MIDLTPILQALIGILAALITVKVIPWIKSKTTAQQQATLSVLVDVLVYAAEQMYASGAIQSKLEYVKAELEKRGYVVDIAQIEAAVKRMNDGSPSGVLNEYASGLGKLFGAKVDEDAEETKTQVNGGMGLSGF